MLRHQPILLYLLVFLALSILLKIFGLIDFSGSEILGYAFIFYGISVVYISFGKERRLQLFIGTAVFLTGLVLFITNNFDFIDSGELLLPSALFITAISFLIVFIDNSSSKTLIILSLVFFAAGFIYTMSFGTMNFGLFFQSLLDILLKYWPIVLIMAGIIFLINRDNKYF